MTLSKDIESLRQFIETNNIELPTIEALLKERYAVVDRDKLLVDRSLIYTLSDTDGCNKWWACIHARANEDVDTEKLAQDLAQVWNTRAPTAREKELEALLQPFAQFGQALLALEKIGDIGKLEDSNCVAAVSGGGGTFMLLWKHFNEIILYLYK